MKLIIILIIIINLIINFVLSNNNHNTIELKVSNDKGIDIDGCGGLNFKSTSTPECKSIEFSIKQYKDKYKINYSKLKLIISPGEYINNQQQDLYDLNISFENSLLSQLQDEELLPILKLVNLYDEENESIDIDDQNEEEAEEKDKEEDKEEEEEEIEWLNENYINYEILEEIENEKENLVIFKNNNQLSTNMFYISSKSKNEIKFKGISFYQGQGGEKQSQQQQDYIINFGEIGSGLDLTILNCNFENGYNKFINIEESSNQQVSLKIKNSKFVGNHIIASGNEYSSIRLLSTTSTSTTTTNVEIENSIFQNIRGLPISIKLSNGLSASIPVPASIPNNNRVSIKTSLFKDNIGGVPISIFGIQNVLIENSLFDSNEQFVKGDGGALSIIKCAKVSIDSCSFHRNQVKGFGGAIYLKDIKQRASISNSLFLENYAYNGGSMNFDKCNSIELQSNRVINNIATLFGGSIYCSNSNIEFLDNYNEFQNNYVTSKLQNVNSQFTSKNNNNLPSAYKKQYYYGFDCLVENNNHHQGSSGSGSTCTFKGTNSTMIKELLKQPNCSGKSFSIFMLDNFQYILYSLLALFIPILIYLFFKITKTREENFKNFLISEDDNNNNNNIKKKKNK